MKLKTILTLMMLILHGVTLAGTGEGGGHSLEAHFKARLESIIDDISLMSDQAKSKLNFNHQSLNAVIKLEVMVLCADENQIGTLKENNKLAYVFKRNSREIRLDCSEDEDTLRNWDKRLRSTDVLDHVFFLHEAIRAQNILNDDNYEYSSSLLSAHRQNTIDQDERIFKLLHTRNNGCTIQFNALSDDKSNVAELHVKGRKVNSFVIGKDEGLMVSQNSFLNASSQLSRLARKNLLFKAQEQKCF